MKKILLMLALAGGVASAHAQSADTTAVNDLTLEGGYLSAAGGRRPLSRAVQKAHL